MKVGDLIKMLQGFDPELEVFVRRGIGPRTTKLTSKQVLQQTIITGLAVDCGKRKKVTFGPFYWTDDWYYPDEKYEYLTSEGPGLVILQDQDIDLGIHIEEWMRQGQWVETRHIERW